MMEGSETVKFRAHIGGAHYVSVTSGYQCVDMRKFYQPFGSIDADIKPTKKGVALRLDEWTHLVGLIDVINTAHPSLATAMPCYFEESHASPTSWLSCCECHPFLNNLSQPTV